MSGALFDDMSGHSLPAGDGGVAAVRARPAGHATTQTGIADGTLWSAGEFVPARTHPFFETAQAGWAQVIGWPEQIPTKAIDFIDNRSYGNRMGRLQPLVTRRYADFGMQRSAICRAPGIARR